MTDFKPHADDIDLTNGQGLCYKRIVDHGTGDSTPQKEDKVTCHYTGRLLDGTVFDSSKTRGQPFEFTIGKGQVIKGWDLGIATMKKGERAFLTCAPSYAYGASAMGSIPANSTLIFEVEMIGWKGESDLADGLGKVTLTHGSGWQSPKDGWKVLLEIVVRSKAAGEAAAPLAHVGSAAEPVSYVVGSNLQRGLELALPKMKLGEVARLTCERPYAESPWFALPDGAGSFVLDVTLHAWRRREDISEARDGSLVALLFDDSKSYDKPSDGSAVVMSVTVRAAGAAEPVASEAAFSFVLGSGEERVPLALEAVATSLALDAHAEVRGPAAAFAPLVPAGATGEYEALVQLTQLVREEPPSKTTELAELAALAGRRKDAGGRWFARGIFAKADRKYRSAIEALNKRESDLTAEHKTGLVLTCYLNSAACALKQSNWADAVAQASHALEIDGANVKGLFRRAQARHELREYEAAAADLKALLAVEPANEAAQALLARVTKLHANQVKQEKNMYARMLS